MMSPLRMPGKSLRRRGVVVAAAVTAAVGLLASSPPSATRLAAPAHAHDLDAPFGSVSVRSTWSAGQPHEVAGQAPALRGAAVSSGSDPRIGLLYYDDVSTGKKTTCTATVVPSRRHDVILTAGHCLMSRASTNFNTGFKFIPGYSRSRGIPYGVFYAVGRPVIDYGWADHADPRYDFGFLILDSNEKGKEVGDVVGSYGIEAGAGYGSTGRCGATTVLTARSGASARRAGTCRRLTTSRSSPARRTSTGPAAAHGWIATTRPRERASSTATSRNGPPRRTTVRSCPHTSASRCGSSTRTLPCDDRPRCARQETRSALIDQAARAQPVVTAGRRVLPVRRTWVGRTLTRGPRPAVPGVPQDQRWA